MIEREILCRIALTRALYNKSDPSSFKDTVPSLTPPVPPKTTAKNLPPRGDRRLTGRKKGKSKLVLFVLHSFANKIHWKFPFFRPVASHPRIQTKGQKAGPQITGAFTSVNAPSPPHHLPVYLFTSPRTPSKMVRK